MRGFHQLITHQLYIRVFCALYDLKNHFFTRKTTATEGVKAPSSNDIPPQIFL